MKEPCVGADVRVVSDEEPILVDYPIAYDQYGLTFVSRFSHRILAIQLLMTLHIVSNALLQSRLEAESISSMTTGIAIF